MKCCNNLRFNTANLEELERAQKFQQVERIREMIMQKIVEKQVGWRHVPLWDAYYKEFDEIKQRYPFFVLEGQTKTAKKFCQYGKINYAGKKIPKEELQEKASRSSLPCWREFNPQQPRIFRSRGAVFSAPLFRNFLDGGFGTLSAVFGQNAAPELGSPWLKTWPRNGQF